MWLRIFLFSTSTFSEYRIACQYVRQVRSKHPERGSPRTHQEGPWLEAGWKSNASQTSVKVKQTLLKICREGDLDGASGRLGKEWGSLVFAWSLGFLTGDYGPVQVSSETSRNWSEWGQGPGVLCQAHIPWSQWSWCGDIELQCNRQTTALSLPRDHLLCWKTPKMSLSLCPLQGGHVWRWDMCREGGAGPSKNGSRKRSKGEKTSLFFHEGPAVGVHGSYSEISRENCVAGQSEEWGQENSRRRIQRSQH